MHHGYVGPLSNHCQPRFRFAESLLDELELEFASFSRSLDGTLKHREMMANERSGSGPTLLNYVGQLVEFRW